MKEIHPRDVLLHAKQAPNKFIRHAMMRARHEGNFAGEASGIPFTPPELIEEISDKIEPIKNRCVDVSICVLYTYEWALWLFLNGFKNITVVTRTFDPSLEKFSKGMLVQGGIEYMTEQQVVESGRKFDVVVGNPPFNDQSSIRTDSSKRQGGRIMSKLFIDLSLDLSLQHIVLISSVSKIWSGASKSRNVERWVENGLYEVLNVSDRFTTVDKSFNIGCFLFNKTNPKQKVVDHWDVCGDPVPNNLARRWRGAQGTNRKDISKHFIDDVQEGKYVIFETAAVIRRTNVRAIYDSVESLEWDNTYRVVFSKIRTDKIGRTVIASPGDKLSSSASCLVCDSYDEALRIKQFLDSPETVELVMKIKNATSDYNSKYLFERLVDPTINTRCE